MADDSDKRTIVDRLREMAKPLYYFQHDKATLNEAANEIERLRTASGYRECPTCRAPKLRTRDSCTACAKAAEVERLREEVARLRGGLHKIVEICNKLTA